MLLRHRVRDLLLASWDADPEQVALLLPAGLRPAAVDERQLVTIAALRSRGGRLGLVPVPPFSQLNVRLYAEHEGRAGVVFVALRVTLPGLGAALFGAPVRPARLRVEEGLVQAPGLGVHIAYDRCGPAERSELTGHERGLYEAAGLREVRVRRAETAWERAEPTAPVSADPLLALGLRVEGEPSLLYAARTTFELELPARRVSP